MTTLPRTIGFSAWQLATLCAGLFTSIAFGAVLPSQPLPAPAVPPLIGDTYPQDQNRDRIADHLFEQSEVLWDDATEPPLMKVTRVKSMLFDSHVNVELIFNEPITQEQVEAFVALGGEITYLYRSVSYGWNGRIPLSEVLSLPDAMGGTLVLVDEPVAVEWHLNVATQSGRVRPVWANGFAGSTGYSGNTNITIAILDTGVDEAHTDLNGRRVYWADFTPDGNASPIDVQHHGTHVAGIAVGSGASGGAGTGTLLFSQQGTLGSSVSNGSFFPAPFELPASSVNVRLTAQWTGGGSTTLHLASHVKGESSGYGSHGSVSGPSPLTLNVSLTGNSTRAYTPALLSIAANTVSNFVVTVAITNHTGVGDGFNKLRGVAPECHWAAAKVFQNNGSGFMSYTDAAIDDLVTKRITHGIKVMNLSLGVSDAPGLSASTRQKVNTAVNNGIVMVVSAGNSGGAADIHDPGRAAMAITVAAANDINQLTDYTSRGFTSPSSTAGQEEDYKPDLMAPGGSTAFHTQILSTDSGSGDEGSFSDQEANDYLGLQGTSMASPFVAGAAALVIDAMQRAGTNWSHSSSLHARLVKMVLCATASESNTNRESAGNSPSLERASAGPNSFPAGKDRYEGYGMLNVDAAVSALSTHFPAGTTNVLLGSASTDRRVWASTVTLSNGYIFTAQLAVPGTGDFDLYLYSLTPSAYGTPVLIASSTGAGDGVAAALTNAAPGNSTALLVVKRVSGSGTFTLTTGLNAPPVPRNPSLGAMQNQPATMSAGKLASDPDGDALVFSVNGTSTAGGTVSVLGGVVTYTPPLGYSGSDTFTFTCDDGRGGTTNGTVTVTVTGVNAVSLNVVSPPAIQGGNFVVRFAGIPGRTYTIEWAAAITGPWTQATNVTAPTTNGGFGIGVFEFSEPTGGDTSRFYRTVYPSY